MKQVISGANVDVTATVKAYLATARQLYLADLYLIGELEDPQAIWLTNWNAALNWPVWGTFQPAVIKRGQVSTKVGLEVTTLDVEWTPANATFTSSISTASPYQLAQLGHYDNWRVRVWRCFMPTPGDANTYGACELFGGRISNTTIERGKVKWTVTSFLDVINQLVPTNVIELTSTLAGYKGATPPSGLSQIPQFNVIVGSTPSSLIADCTSPSAHQIFTDNLLRLGFIVFNSGGTLDRRWSAILSNQLITIAAVNYNQIVLVTPLPWAPTPGTDTFYVSGALPIDPAEGSTDGFPYVPNPEGAL